MVLAKIIEYWNSESNKHELDSDQQSRYRVERFYESYYKTNES